MEAQQLDGSNESPIARGDLITFRAGIPGDEHYIMDTWLTGVRYSNDWFKAISKETFKRNYTRIIKELLEYSTVRIACLIDDPDVILGFSVMQGPIIHWVNVKEKWRGIGLMRELTRSPFENQRTISHMTKAIRPIAKKLGWEFNPFV